MKVIKADLPRELERIEILPLADFHIGDMMSDWKLIQELLARVKDDPLCYCILGGDLMDTAIASSIGDTYAANVQPMEQLQMCVKLFEPIKDKILACVAGNHENRIYKSDGVDMTQIMCNQLGIGERYSSTTALIYVRLGENKAEHKNRQQVYSIYLSHGSGGGRREGGKINRLADMAEIIDADVYVCAHTHLPATFKTEFARADAANRSVQWVTHTFVNAAASLRYGGYGERNGYKPASRECPVIVLDGRKKKVKVIV